MAVLAVSGNHPVILAKNRDHSNRDCLFAVVEVEEAADLLLGVKFGALVLEVANADHLL